MKDDGFVQAAFVFIATACRCLGVRESESSADAVGCAGGISGTCGQ